MKNLIAATVLGLSMASAANAAPFQGAFYDVGGYGTYLDPGSVVGAPLADSNAAVLAFLAGNPVADATFTSGGIGYGAQAIGSLADFLSTDAGSIIGDGTTSFLGSILTFSGTIDLLAGLNNNFEVFSDDGFLLYINGVLAGSYDGLRAPSSSLFAVDGGAGGHAQFDLIYYEGSQVLAALDVNLNGNTLAPVPLPAGGLLLIGAIGGLAALRRRKLV